MSTVNNVYREQCHKSSCWQVDCNWEWEDEHVQRRYSVWWSFEDQMLCGRYEEIRRCKGEQVYWCLSEQMEDSIETFWRGCEGYSQVNNLSCLWNQGCLQNVQELFFFYFFIKVDFKIKFMSCLKNQSWYKNGAKTPIFWIFVMVHVFG